MMGPAQEVQAILFYEVSLEDHVPQDHLLRSIDRFIDLCTLRRHLARFHRHTGRPSVDPERPMKLRKKAGLFFAHLKPIPGPGRLRLRGPCGANDEFLRPVQVETCCEGTMLLFN